MTDFTEQRREQRQPTRCRATARVALSIELLDASVHGFRARCPLPLPIGSTLRIGMPGGADRHARISWNDGDEFGGEFLAALGASELDKVVEAGAIATPRAALG